MADLIVIVIVLAIVGVAVAYIIKEKRRGAKCIGCPAGGECGKAGNGCSGCGSAATCMGSCNCTGDTEK